MRSPRVGKTNPVVRRMSVTCVGTSWSMDRLGAQLHPCPKPAPTSNGCVSP